MKENEKQPFQVFETDDLLDIRKDPVFKAVFTKENPAARGALSRLVSALIGRDITINRIWANEQPIDSLGDRKIRYDINCRAENGERINVEMGFYPKIHEPVRFEFHAGKLFSSQEISGKERNFNDLKETYQIAILSNKKFFGDNGFFHSFEYYDPAHKASLGGRTRIITIELAKLGKIAEKPADEMSVQESWAFFFEYLTDKDKRAKINEILKLNKGIAMAGESLMTLSQDEDERMRLYMLEKEIIDYNMDRAYALKEGREEGRAEERQYFFELLNQGLSAEQIKQRLEQKQM